MKNFYYLAVALMAAVFFVSCSDIWMVTPSGTGVAP